MERLDTTIISETMLEHLHRYTVAANLVHGKKVLDIACGEGYGSDILSKQATSVTAVDLDESTINKAKIKYQSSGVTFTTGSVYNIPSPDHAYDVVVCFETLEHVDDHDKVLNELKRVLAPEGVLLISTPDKNNYSDARNYKNPFHVKELYGHEFKKLLSSFFKNTAFYGQHSLSGSFISIEPHQGIDHFYTGNYEQIQQASIPVEMYWLGIASDATIPRIHGSSFLNPSMIADMLATHTASTRQTLTYRTGNFILSPFKFLRSLFKK